MKILWCFVILAAVNGNQDVSTNNGCATNRWGEAEGELKEVRLDGPFRTCNAILNANLEFSVGNHAGNVMAMKVAIKLLVLVLARNVNQAGREINVLHQCVEKINVDGMVYV